MSYELNEAMFDNDPNTYFLKWGDNQLATSGGEITWSMNLDDLDFDETRFSRRDFELAVQAAFGSWQSVANVSFRLVDYDPDPRVRTQIVIETASETERASLAGPTVGVASYSFGYVDERGNDAARLYQADIFMDTQPTWSPRGDGGLDFFAVVLHEIGHTLGLDHVNDSSEIMNATVSASTLGDGDIAGIRALYGTNGAEVVPEASEANDILDFSTSSEAQNIAALGGDDIVSGSAVDDRISGGAGDDTLFGNGGADYLIDTLGSNTLRGNSGDDVIIGGSGTLQGTGGNGGDIILGGIGSDRLDGGDGNDSLRGDPSTNFFYGRDLLVAGKGTDYLEGGGGVDTFEFKTGDDSNYIARLDIDLNDPTRTRALGADFEVGIDQIDLTDFGYSSFDDVSENIRTLGENAVFNDQGTIIHFVGIAAGMLTGEDFIL